MTTSSHRSPDPAVRLADLMGARVLDAAGRDIGHVSDVRFVEAADPQEGGRGPGRLRLEGLVVATRRRGRMLGYDHRPVDAPWPLTALARRAARHALWAPWTVVTAHRPPSRTGETGTITLSESAADLTPLEKMHAHWNPYDSGA
ncbi:PRC-barrel domain-containing protein [Streptomyces sp. NPDC091268]|uniref:PRC-barrel domain-containing protein n=1 Tax=Streptomyces sp. NPDC091268 TaxID=3365979 RepID=UPI003821BB09